MENIDLLLVKAFGSFVFVFGLNSTTIITLSTRLGKKKIEGIRIMVMVMVIEKKTHCLFCGKFLDKNRQESGTSLCNGVHRQEFMETKQYVQM